MKALRFDGALKLVNDAPIVRLEGESLVKVICAGICNTDLEIAKGYAGFSGTIGHEFVGRVVESADGELVGRRVVGEINVGCGICDLCMTSDSRHCPKRTVLGIKGRDGALAEYLSLPSKNLLVVPDSISDEAAVFVEPLAAALNILEQVSLNSSDKVAVIGDGKLAQLIVRVVAQTNCALTIIGKHERKLELAKVTRARCLMLDGPRRFIDIDGNRQIADLNEKFDIVIETSGSSSGLPLALSIVRPRGTIVLKSTHHAATPLDMAQVVVNEVKIIGSRCGLFPSAINFLAKGAIDVRPLISNRFQIEDAIAAFDKAAAPATMKVIIGMSNCE